MCSLSHSYAVPSCFSFCSEVLGPPPQSQLSLQSVSSRNKFCFLVVRNAVGIGNGQKKSKPFESYVLEQRAWLKEKYGFCETGTKRVLLYSNNFLHKRSKTDPEVNVLILMDVSVVCCHSVVHLTEFRAPTACQAKVLILNLHDC